MKRVALLGVVLALAACRSNPAPAPSTTVPFDAAPATGDSSAPAPSAVAPIDAGPLPAFTFVPLKDTVGQSVEIPSFFLKSAPHDDSPELAFGTVAWMQMIDGGMCNSTLRELCTAPDGGTRSLSATTCLATGIEGTKIRWERSEVVDDAIYTLVVVYDRDVKEAFDPILAHMAKTWHVPVKSAGYYCGPPAEMR